MPSPSNIEPDLSPVILLTALSAIFAVLSDAKIPITPKEDPRAAVLTSTLLIPTPPKPSNK